MKIERHYEGTDFVTGLRAIAVLMVFLIHSGGGLLSQYGESFRTLIDHGKHGVDIFFVISGFTIYYQLAHKKVKPARFILLRLSRISTPYFPLLILLGALYAIGLYDGSTYWLNYFGEGSLSLLNYLAHFLYLGSVIPSFSNTVIGVEWSLNVEAFFYLVFFAIAAASKSKKLRNPAFTTKLIIAGLAISFSGIILSSKRVGIELFDGTSFHVLAPKWTLMFGLGGLAYHLRYRLNKDMTLLSITTFGACIFLLSYLNAPSVIASFAYALVTFFVLIFCRDNSLFSKVLNNHALRFLGSISFSFYLWHSIVLHYTEYEGWKDFIYPFFYSIAVSAVWYFLFEMVIYNKIRKYILKNDTDQSTTYSK